MRNIKKHLSFFALSLALTTLSLTGCGNATTETSNTTTASITEVTSESTSEVTSEEAQTMTTEATSEATIEETTEQTTTAPIEDITIRIGSLKGPTSIGLAALMHESANGETTGTYTFDIEADASVLLQETIKGNLDIALIPANAAAIWSQKLEGDLTVLNINTLGVLYCVADESLSLETVADLKGMTIYMTGKGTTPEYVLAYELSKRGLDINSDVNVQFYSEATEVVGALATADLQTTVAILPQPFVTVAKAKMNNLTSQISLADEWDAVTEDGSRQVTGVTVVRTSYLEAHTDAVMNFTAEQAASVTAVNADPKAASEWVVEAGIIEKAPIAEAAIPYCNLTQISGTDMRNALEGYLQVLYDSNPQSVGGSMPGDDFYYCK